MLLGALVDTGLALSRLEEGLAGLGISGFRLRERKVRRGAICGTKVDVEITVEEKGPRYLKDIQRIIAESRLEAGIKARALAVFERLAEAEARVHGVGVEEIHFHEVGALDAIVDIVGGVFGLAELGVERLVVSPVHVGCGQVRTQHGVLPVPAPATLEILRGRPIYATGVEAELATPTGAALVATLGDDFGPCPKMVVEEVGYGAGSMELEGLPNMLRLWVGRTEERLGEEQVAVVETDIDDMNPEWYGPVVEGLLGLGALDVTLGPNFMKRQRPGVRLGVVCRPELVHRVAEFILRQTTSLGVRFRVESKLMLPRKMQEVQTPYGRVRVKVAYLEGRVQNVAPEFEDCQRLAEEAQVTVKEVYQAALAEGLRLFKA